MKICCRCKIPKELEEFHNLKSSKDGKRHWCKECHKLETNVYYENNKERIKTLSAEWYEEKGKAEKYSTKWRKNNRQKDNKRSADYQRNRRKIDPNFRLKGLLRSQVRIYIIKAKGIKSMKTLTLIGCSIEELKVYFESKFTEGMSWNNQGEWHIDHIKPCASFDLTDLEQQKLCFHYTNLQPLWAKDNLTKNSMYNGVLIRKNNKKNE